MTRRVLMLTHRVPYPPDRGDRIRSYHLLRHLAQHFDVTLGCVSDEPITETQRRVLAGLASQVAIEPIAQPWSAARGGAALLTRRAITPAMFYRPRLSARLLDWHARMPFDAVLTFCTGMTGYTRDLLQRCDRDGSPRPRVVLDLVDVDSIKWSRFAAASRPPQRWIYAAEAHRLAKLERGRDADAITVISEFERRAYQREVGIRDNIHVVGNGVDLDYFTPLPDSPAPTLAFVGVLNYKPNVDGITWFVRQVLPLVRERVRGARLLIVGRDPSPAVAGLAQHPGVEVVGSVPDVRAYLAQAAAVVAPLHIAPGVQNKVLEAMACARPVVCTAAAAAGINARPDRDLLVADDPPSFAHQVNRLLMDSSLRRHIAAAARRQVQTRYSWSSRLAPMVTLLRGNRAATMPRRRLAA